MKSVCEGEKQCDLSLVAKLSAKLAENQSCCRNPNAPGYQHTLACSVLVHLCACVCVCVCVHVCVCVCV